MASLQQVAERAGVSTTTASRVLSRAPGVERISTETRQVVFQAAQALEYEASTIARALRTGRSCAVGFLAPDVPSPFLSAILAGAERVLQKNGYHILISITEQDPQEEDAWLASFTQRIDGALVTGGSYGANAGRVLAGFRRRGVAVALIGIEWTGTGVPSVLVDNLSAAREAVVYLASLGHRRIGYVGCESIAVDHSGVHRLAGYKSGLEHAGIPYDPTQVVMAPHPVEGCGYVQAKHLLNRSPDTTAVLAFNDYLAMGVIQAARELGRLLPQELSVIGFDDMPWAPHLSPALTSVRQPLEQVGCIAAEKLLEQMRDSRIPTEEVRSETGIHKGTSVVLEAELVVRESTASPARAPSMTHGSAGLAISERSE